ncbi:MAG: hypothetical protein IKZ82_14240 [Clostridia bacterium]|nr:hypothetical protein [Clostridia bacterium]
MDIIGKWRIAFMPRMDDDGLSWMSAEVLRQEAATGQDKDMLMLLDALYIFEPDGCVTVAMKLPESVSKEEIEQAVASEQITLYGEDRFTTGESKNTWKLENGKVMYDTGISGEVLGEPVSSWTEVVEIDGMIELPFMRLKRVE